MFRYMTTITKKPRNQHVAVLVVVISSIIIIIIIVHNYYITLVLPCQLLTWNMKLNSRTSTIHLGRISICRLLNFPQPVPERVLVMQ